MDHQGVLRRLVMQRAAGKTLLETQGSFCLVRIQVCRPVILMLCEMLPVQREHSGLVAMTPLVPNQSVIVSRCCCTDVQLCTTIRANVPIRHVVVNPAPRLPDEAVRQAGCTLSLQFQASSTTLKTANGYVSTEMIARSPLLSYCPSHNQGMSQPQQRHAQSDEFLLSHPQGYRLAWV